MAGSDWEPTPGRFLVLLPLPADDGAEEALRRLEALAGVFKKERHLRFRAAPVSDAAFRLVPAAAAGGGAEQQPGGAAAAAAQQPMAYVLHPRRGRFQEVPLGGDPRAAVLRLEDVLGGGGTWREAALPS